MNEEKQTQKELNESWLKFAEIIERHGKENGVPEWVSMIALADIREWVFLMRCRLWMVRRVKG